VVSSKSAEIKQSDAEQQKNTALNSQTESN